MKNIVNCKSTIFIIDNSQQPEKGNIFPFDESQDMYNKIK
jgi:hypothetical protein